MTMILKFLKELPDRYLLLICFFVVMGFYVYFRTDAVLQLMINFAVAIIAISTKRLEPTTQVTTGPVTTPSINTNSMDSATITTDSINTGTDTPKE